MRFGVTLPQNTADAGELLKAARTAEEAGLDSVWVVDNLQERPDPRVPFLESWTSLSAAAAATSRVGVGTLAQRVTLRNPAVAAAMAATLDKVAPGRLTMALGVGDASSKQEQAAFGLPWEPKAVRFEKLERTVAALRETVPHVPLWLGGESDETISHAGAFDGWNYWGPAANFPTRAAVARRFAGGKDLELTWSGPYRDFDLAPLKESGCSYAIIATNAANYEKRIETTRALIDQDRKKSSHD